MTENRGRIRVYQCSNCTNIGYIFIQSEHDELSCSLCKTLLPSSPTAIITDTVEEAEKHMRELVFLSQQKKEPIQVTRGAGIRKRVLRIVDALVDLNRGRDVTIDAILQECIDAGIDREKAYSFLDSLIETDILNCVNGKVSIIKDGVTL